MDRFGIVFFDDIDETEEKIRRLESKNKQLRQTVSELVAIIEHELFLSRSHSANIEKDFELSLIHI